MVKSIKPHWWKFIQKKYHGSLTWIEEKKELRKSPKNLWPEAKSAIVFGFNYGPQNNPLLELNENSKAYVAVYARRKDYHNVLMCSLNQIASKIVPKLNGIVKEKTMIACFNNILPLKIVKAT